MQPLLTIEDLAVRIGPLAVLDGVSLALPRGGALGLVGESGCGKSMLALALLRLLPPGGAITGGRIMLDGTDLVAEDAAALRSVRGRRIAMVFQDPMSSLHPAMRIGAQIVAAMRAHDPNAPRARLRARMLEALARARVPDPPRVARALPGELSGGLCQRAMIAMALSMRPDLLVADEPTTALDPTVAAEILDLLGRLRREEGLALLLITHDLALLASRAERIAVMYAGRVVESAPAERLFADAQHPYTLGLLASQPKLDAARGAALAAIPGGVPSPGDWPTGCRFRPRCPFAVAACAVQDPALRAIAPGHDVACIRAPL